MTPLRRRLTPFSAFNWSLPRIHSRAGLCCSFCPFSYPFCLKRRWCMGDFPFYLVSVWIRWSRSFTPLAERTFRCGADFSYFLCSLSFSLSLWHALLLLFTTTAELSLFFLPRARRRLHSLRWHTLRTLSTWSRFLFVVSEVLSFSRDFHPLSLSLVFPRVSSFHRRILFLLLLPALYVTLPPLSLLLFLCHTVVSLRRLSHNGPAFIFTCVHEDGGVSPLFYYYC